MANEKIKFRTVTPPPSEDKWANATLEDGRTVSIAPDKWAALNPKPAAGYEGEYDIYTNNQGKTYLKAAQQKGNSFGGGKGGNSSGQAIGSAINNAVTLIVHGKADLKDLKITAARILDIGIELKEQYKDKI